MFKKALFVIANSWFQDHEYWEPRHILEESWIDITVASNKKGICIGAFWATTIAKFNLEEVHGYDYDVVVMIWWPWAWQAFHSNLEYLRISKEAKLLWAICIAPAIVSESWLYNGVEVTWWDNWGEQIDYIEKNGWIYTWKSVTVSWKYITANWPKAASEFGEELVKILK